MPLLSVEDLTVDYRHEGVWRRAVEGVSFAIEPGEVFALVGESGSGKSSVALALTRLLPQAVSRVSGRVGLRAIKADVSGPVPACRTALGAGRARWPSGRPRHRATASGRGPLGFARASGWVGCRPTRDVLLGATSSARGAPTDELGGLNLLEASEETLRRVRGRLVSYVFQEPSSSLNPVLTIGEQLLETMQWHLGLRGEEARRCALQWLARVGIPSADARLGAYPHEFSGGMQQRACLAMALATQPMLLVADEPTTALDVTIQIQILRLVRELQRTLGLSVLLISHDLLIVERLAHRVAVMAGGHLVELGPVAQVLRAPQHPATMELLEARAKLSLRGQTPLGSDPDG